MKFVKMHGCGNDYVYVNVFREQVRNPSALAVAMSDRHRGVGSDGLILIGPSKRADFRMRMFNADGSEGEMCGNGIRCIGKYVYERGLTRKRAIRVETKGGNVAMDLHVGNRLVRTVTVDMGPSRPVPKAFHVRADGLRRILKERLRIHGLFFDAHILSMGNPHCVFFVKDVDHFPVERVGPAVERCPNFPSRTNVEFAEVIRRGHVRQRTWERGSGETLACGSGACAVAAALMETRSGLRKVRIDLRGGTLWVERSAHGSLLMTGPATDVFEGEWPGRF